MYEGGIIVPLLIGAFLMVVVFSIERFLTIKKASGTGNNDEFVRKVQFHLANKNVDAALAECDKQKGSVGNVMKAGLKKYKEMISDSALNTEQKVLAIQKEVEEATALELPMLQKNLVFLSTLTSLGTLVALLGTVLGMIKSFSSLGEEGGSGAAAEFIIASSSDPGQEFFILGWNMANNTPYRDVIAIFKDTNGNWAVEADDGGSYYGIFQNPDLTSNVALQGIGSVDSHPFTNSIGRIPFITSSNSYTGGQNASNRLVYPAHPKLWITSDTAFNFGGYYAANNRVFYGVSQRNWVVETT